MAFLRSPQFGNSWSVTVNQSQERNLGGELLPRADQLFPQFEQFEVSFVALSKQQIDDFINFLIENRGIEIFLNDFENTNWQGVIPPQKIEIIRGRKGCNYQTSFTFEGLKV